MILAAPNARSAAKFQGRHLLNIAPTLLELGGYDVPPSMTGTSLLTSAAVTPVSPRRGTRSSASA
jgi:bisphosphoglycerate-independent phosphoglycerate mutase (AlkP superfamily)